MTLPPLLIVGLAALFAATLALAFVFVGESDERMGISRAIATIERGYGGAPAGGAESQRPQVPQDSLKDRVGVPLARKLGELGKALTPAGARMRLERQLDYAGNPGGWPVERVISAKGVGLVLGLAAGVLMGLVLGGVNKGLLAVLGAAVFGFFLPDLAIYNLGTKRQDELRRSLPDVLDTLTICVEAGQGFDAALGQVARNGRGPMIGEAARVLQEMRIGKSRVEAMRSLGARTTVEELRGFASAVIQASDLGVPVGKVLREQAREMRVRRRQRAEEAAQKVPIKILFPTMFLLFPALFIVIIGPGILGMMGKL